MLCVKVNGSAIEVDSASTAPACGEYMLVTPVEYETLTYWAQLDQQIQPGSAPFNALVVVIIAAYGTVAAMKMVISNLKILNRET